MAMENDYSGIETVMLRDEIGRCEDVDELKERILPILSSQKEQWSKKVNEIMATSGFTKSKFAELCGVSRVTLDKWLNGAVPRRERLIRIGLVANYNVNQMNQLLQRYGQYPELYSKNIEDFICLFVLQHKSDNQPLQEYQYILERIKTGSLSQSKRNEDPDLSTHVINKQIGEIQNIEELERFIEANANVFSNAYEKFYTYVMACIVENGYALSVNELAEGQEWSSSLRITVSAIRQKKWEPTRNKIISLGLHLSMDREQIDYMFKLAHMEPLCAKNVFESVIIFILEDASVNDMLDSESDMYDPDDLYKYAKEVIEELNLPEMTSFLSELKESE